MPREDPIEERILHCIPKSVRHIPEDIPAAAEDRWNEAPAGFHHPRVFSYLVDACRGRHGDLVTPAAVTRTIAGLRRESRHFRLYYHSGGPSILENIWSIAVKEKRATGASCKQPVASPWDFSK